MGIFASLFRSLKMATTGKVVHQIDFPVMDGMATLSLRLKREKGDKHYAVLAILASGNYQYLPLEMQELDQLVKAVEAIREVAKPAT